MCYAEINVLGLVFFFITNKFIPPTSLFEHHFYPPFTNSYKIVSFCWTVFKQSSNDVWVIFFLFSPIAISFMSFSRHKTRQKPPCVRPIISRRFFFSVHKMAACPFNAPRHDNFKKKTIMASIIYVHIEFFFFMGLLYWKTNEKTNEETMEKKIKLVIDGWNVCNSSSDIISV